MVQFVIEYEYDTNGDCTWEAGREVYVDKSKSLHKIVKHLRWLNECVDVRKLKCNGKLVDIKTLPTVTSWKNAGEKIKNELEN